MSGNGYHILFLVVLVNLNIKQGVFGDEPSEESQPHYEYTQVFKSIPTLFEYLFDALEERPEILEKNDATMFERNIHGFDTDKCESSADDGNTEKREISCDQSTLQDFNDLDKRDASNSKDVTETTVAHEYGNSKIVTKGLDEQEGNKVSTSDVIRTKKEIPTKGKISSRKKLNTDVNTKFKDNDEAFLGFEHLFGLDLKPEDIEERILAAEKLLEEHNNKKDNQD